MFTYQIRKQINHSMTNFKIKPSPTLPHKIPHCTQLLLVTHIAGWFAHIGLELTPNINIATKTNLLIVQLANLFSRWQLRSVFTYAMFLIVFTVIWLAVCYYLCKKPQIASDSSPICCSQDELSEKSLLATKKDELDASSRQWKSRVEKSDAEKFSVAGKMSERIRDATPTINIKDVDENEKRTPQAKRFKLKGESYMVLTLII